MGFLRSTMLAGLSLLVLLTAGAASAATVAEWRQDIDRIVADIRATHPEPFGKVGELRFLREAEDIKENLPALTEEQRIVRVMRLVAMIGDGHTQLRPGGPEFARWYPFRAYEFEDGFFITGAHRSVPELAGAQVLEIGDAEVARVAADARALMGADNPFDARERVYALSNAGLMAGLGHAGSDGTLRMRLKLRNGRVVERIVSPLPAESSDFDWIFQPEYRGAVGEPEEWISAYRGQTAAQLRIRDDSRPLHIRYRRAFVAIPVPDRSAYYIQTNQVGGSQDGESFPAFFRRALGEVDRLRPEHLIVDIRHNFGGDGSNVIPVLHEFISRKNDPPWRNLYFLTGRRTFSAGVLMLAEFLTHMQPTLVGEPAGAPLNSFGDPNSFEYSATQLRLSVSHERHQKGKSTDLSRFIPVDIPARFTFADYAAGRDPAVDPILAGSEMRSIPAIAASEDAAAAYAVYVDRQSRFDETWRPTAEIDLRMIMRELADQGRTDAAIEVARLNTRINPQEWRTWMNLGNLQHAAGQEAEAIENYRRSLDLNDPTNFNTERLRRIVDEADARRQAEAGQER